MAKSTEEKAVAKAAKDAEKAATKVAGSSAPVDANAADPNPAAADKPAKASKTEVTVKYRDHKGEPTERTFSKEDHGEDFAKLADEFKETNATRIIA